MNVNVSRRAMPDTCNPKSNLLDAAPFIPLDDWINTPHSHEKLAFSLSNSAHHPQAARTIARQTRPESKRREEKSDPRHDMPVTEDLDLLDDSMVTDHHHERLA